MLAGFPHGRRHGEGIPRLAALRGVTIVERWRHSYDVFPDAERTQPFGSGATCAWPALDLQIENNAPVPHRLSVALTDSHLAGSWTAPMPGLLEYRIEERAHRMNHEGPGIYARQNELWRIEYDPLTFITSEELVAANRALMMYQPFLPPPSRAFQASGR